MKLPYIYSLSSKQGKAIAGTVAALAMVCSTSAECPAQVGFGHAVDFNEGWRFEMAEPESPWSPTSPASFRRPDKPDSLWRHVTLPHDWSIEGQASPHLASGTGYLPGGVGYYVRHFNHDAASSEGRRLYVYFEGVYNRSEVTLNGHLLGKRPNGYASFLYELTPFLREGDNVVEVKVDHSRFADSRYYTGSGIYRNVWLIDAPVSHIAQWGTGFRTESVDHGTASLTADVTVENPLKGMKAEVTLFDASGRKVAHAIKTLSGRRTVTEGNGPATERLELRMKAPGARLWDIDSPYLYTLRTVLTIKGDTIDRSETKVGIRTLEFSPDKGFFLNGRNRKVKGVCIHHDAGMLGAAVPEEVWEHRLTRLKTLGVNALRMSHNPQAPAVYDIADRLGLLVMDEASDEWEFPKRKWVKGWNKGEPSFFGSYDFFEEWIERDVADMVRRDRNHPSVFLWSIGNEVDYPNDPYSHPILDGDNSAISQPMYGGYNPDAPDAMRIGEIAKRLSVVVRGIDRSRPVTGALAGVVMSNQTAYPEAVDVVGYNYTEDRYDTDHAAYPERVIYGSENRSDYDAWTAVRDKDFIFGQFIWTGIDYLGESGEWPSRGLYTGLLDFTGQPKPRGMFRASLWSDTPMTYAGTYPVMLRRGGNRRGGGDWLSIDAWDNWNYEEGDTVRVVCYTTSPAARLTIDGKEAGELKRKPLDSGIIHWDIPYRPGRLTAEGLDEKGNVESEYAIVTSGRPHSLRACVANGGSTGSPGVRIVEIEVTDEQGVPVKLSDNMVTVTVGDGAELLALESADNSDMSNTNYVRFSHTFAEGTPGTGKHRGVRGNRRAFRGKLTAYVRVADPEHNTILRATSPLLCPVEINIR